MAASDIINPSPYWQETIQDSMCPNYGFTRKRATTRLNKKAMGSVPWSRDTQNTGHSFPFSWIGRSQACMKRVKRYYEQFEDGFFTIIDWDDVQPGGGGRHYVGRFTGDFPAADVGNGVWDIQNLLFEEMPGVAMLKYPADWDNDAIRLYAFNDFGDQKLAVLSGTWTTVNQAVGTQTIPMLFDAGAASTDSVCYEYRGYGFKLYLMTGPEFGGCTIQVDGVTVTNPRGLPGSTTFGCNVPGAPDTPSMIFCDAHLPLDFHRVQITQTAGIFVGHGLTPTYLPLQWAWLEVMR